MRDSDKIAIQEMVQIMCKPPSLFATDTANGCYLAVKFAERLYLAGYRKQSEGEWVRRYSEHTDHLGTFRRYDGDFCSVCGVLGDGKFCPNCGAKMKGGAE